MKHLIIILFLIRVPLGLAQNNLDQEVQVAFNDQSANIVQQQKNPKQTNDCELCEEIDNALKARDGVAPVRNIPVERAKRRVKGARKFGKYTGRRRLAIFCFSF